LTIERVTDPVLALDVRFASREKALIRRAAPYC
jgi:hypothetical protein